MSELVNINSISREYICQTTHEFLKIKNLCVRWVQRFLNIVSHSASNTDEKLKELRTTYICTNPTSTAFGRFSLRDKIVLFPQFQKWLDGKIFHSNKGNAYWSLSKYGRTVTTNEHLLLKLSRSKKRMKPCFH